MRIRQGAAAAVAVTLLAACGGTADDGGAAASDEPAVSEATDEPEGREQPAELEDETTEPEPAEPAEPTYDATTFEVDGAPITLELTGCENRVPSDSDSVSPKALVRMTNNGDEPFGVRIHGAVQLDGIDAESYPDGWYSAGMDGGRKLEPGEVYDMAISPDFRHQSNYGPGTHRACKVDYVRVWQDAGDFAEIETDPGLGGPSAGDVDKPTTDRPDESIPRNECGELDGGLFGYSESSSGPLRQFLTAEQCEASL